MISRANFTRTTRAPKAAPVKEWLLQAAAVTGVLDIPGVAA